MQHFRRNNPCCGARNVSCRVAGGHDKAISARFQANCRDHYVRRLSISLQIGTLSLNSAYKRSRFAYERPARESPGITIRPNVPEIRLNMGVFVKHPSAKGCILLHRQVKQGAMVSERRRKSPSGTVVLTPRGTTTPAFSAASAFACRYSWLPRFGCRAGCRPMVVLLRYEYGNRRFWL